MSKLKDAVFTDQEPEESMTPDPEYDRPKLGSLASAFAKAQGELSNVEKKHAGYQNRYKFANLGQVLDMVRPVFSNYGLAIVQKMFDAGDGKAGLTTTIYHESGQWLETTSSMPVHEQKGLSYAQCVGVVTTYLRRYQLAAMVGIAQEDSDAALGEQHKTQKQDFRAPLEAKQDPHTVRDIMKCQSLDELRDLWGELQKHEHILYQEIKDQRKSELEIKQQDEEQAKL